MSAKGQVVRRCSVRRTRSANVKKDSLLESFALLAYLKRESGSAEIPRIW
jgi:hypothetical protein